MAHVRRKFFEAKSSAPESAQKALDFTLELYEIEHKAVELGIFGTEDHSFMRKDFGLEIMTKWKKWLLKEKDNESPKSPMGQVINYTLNNWEYLLRIFDDVKIPLDNNISERALRSIAVGRKNFLFVGNKRAGKNLTFAFLNRTSIASFWRVSGERNFVLDCWGVLSMI